MKKIIIVVSLMMIILSMKSTVVTCFSDDYSNNIAVDITESNTKSDEDGRFINWSIGKVNSDKLTVGNVFFELSTNAENTYLNGKSQENENINSDDNILSRDGVVLSGASKGGIIELEISGLSAGTHTFTSWHNCCVKSNYEITTMTVAINGVDVAENVVIPTMVEKDNLSYVFYESFEVAEGENVTIYFKSDDVANTNKFIFLNAFEIDGVNPLETISEIVPQNGEKHYCDSNISWRAADGAAKHRLYFGTDENDVADADVNDSEYIGEIDETKYDFSQLNLNSIETYYWRVDEVFNNEQIVKGTVNSFKCAQLAFPGAEGNGKYANGGRAGKVVKVTNLNDSGEGSLRWAIEDVTCPRIIVFDVGGVIELSESITINSKNDDVYIAGQTAPGDGITLIKYGIELSSAEDVIIRNIRFRAGEASHTPSSCVSLNSVNNSIIDHCSLSWSNGAIFTSKDSLETTLQYCILSEPLIDAYSFANDDEETYFSLGTGLYIESGSYYRNVINNCMGRAIYFNSRRNPDVNRIDFNNNVVYNWYDVSSEGSAYNIQIENNYFIAGSETNNYNLFRIKHSFLGKLYLCGNVLLNSRETISDNWDLVEIADTSDASIDEIRSNEQVIVNELTNESLEQILSYCGAIAPKRDYIDKRYVNEINNNEVTYSGSKTGLKGYLNSVNDAEGYPNENTFSGAEVLLDTDNDGMPDEWEIEHGLNPNYYYDACEIYLSDEGYTNIELYVNELAGDKVVFSDNPKLTYSPNDSSVIETDNLIGDVNLDKVINAEDALIVLKHAARIQILSDVDLIRANVNHDNSINSIDALIILKHAASIELL